MRVFVFRLTFLAGLIVLLFASLFIYTAIYNKRIKRILENPDTAGRQWPTPRNVVLMILLIVMLNFSLGAISNNRSEEQVVTNVQYSDDTVVCAMSELEGTYAEIYMDVYTTGELVGYKKFEKTEDDFHYICFESIAENDSLHPGYILFIEYVGEGNYGAYGYNSTVYMNNGNSLSGGSYGSADEVYCVIGNVDFSNYDGYRLKFGLYEDLAQAEKDFEQNVDAFPQAVKSMVIELPELFEE